MAGFGKFLVLANLFLSILFMGTGFALWYYRVDLTDTQETTEKPAGLYRVEKDRIQKKNEAFVPAITVYENSLGLVEAQEQAARDEQRFYDEKLTHVKAGAAMGSPVEQITVDVDNTDLTDQSVRNSKVLGIQLLTDSSKDKGPLLSIEKYNGPIDEPEKGLLSQSAKEFRQKSQQLQELLRDEILMTVNLVGTEETKGIVQNRIDALQKDPKADRSVIMTLQEMLKKVDELDRKGIRLRIAGERVNGEYVVLGEREKRKRLETALVALNPKRLEAFLKDQFQRKIPDPFTKDQNVLRPELRDKSGQIQQITNKLKIFDESDQKLEARLAELDPMKAKETLQELIDREKDVIRKLEREITALELQQLKPEN